MVAQLLRLTASPSPPDAADGVAVALTHLIVSTQAGFFRQLTATR
jgi:Holliday junction resolvasome RuvABC endonuclease subunit